MATAPEIENREPRSPDREASASKQRDRNGCCNGPAPEGTEACCALDAELKSAGESGCGCASRATAGTTATKRCC